MSVRDKSLRKQIRNIAQELVTEALCKELEERILKAVFASVHSRMELIAQSTKETLDKIDRRSLDLQGYVVRNLPRSIKE